MSFIYETSLTNSLLNFSAFLVSSVNWPMGSLASIASAESNRLTCPMYRIMQPFSSELEQEESGFLLQQHSPSNNLAIGFSGNFIFSMYRRLMGFGLTNN